MGLAMREDDWKLFDLTFEQISVYTALVILESSRSVLTAGRPNLTLLESIRSFISNYLSNNQRRFQ